MQCSYIPVDRMTLDQFTNIWLSILPLVRKFVSRSGVRVTEKTIMNEVLSREVQLWICFDEEQGNKPMSFVVTRIMNYPSGRLLSFDYIGGEDVESWFDIGYDIISEWASTSEADGGPQCIGIEATGRLGWQRFLKPRGWSSRYTVYELMFEEDSEDGKKPQATNPHVANGNTVQSS